MVSPVKTFFGYTTDEYKIGPVFGPIIGGFVTQYVNWRWANWLICIWGGVACLMIASIKETYAPALLQQKARKVRKETGENRHWSRYDVRVGFVELMKVNLSRPFIMAVKEPICVFWNVYIGIIYGTSPHLFSLIAIAHIAQVLTFISQEFSICASSPTPLSTLSTAAGPSRIPPSPL